MKKSLNGQWRLYISDEAINASKEGDLAKIKPLIANIPETLEATLERLGILPDLFYAENARKAKEYETKHLYYACDFNYVSGDGSPTLCFEGVDTVSEIFLNGKKLGDTDNAFIPHEFAADGIVEGKNELLVHILPSAVLEAKAKKLWEYGMSHYRDVNASLRKPAFTHGWDIFPRLMCGAIWKNVYIEDKIPELIEDVYIYTEEVVWQKAVLAVEYKTAEGDELKISGACERNTFSVSVPAGKGRTEIEVFQPKLWAPKGMGKPNLYDVKVELIRGGETAAEKQYRIGIRTAKLNRTSVTDEQGSGEFCFYINGSRMFCLGTNHVPVDAVLSRCAERLPKALEALDDIGCNTVRIWGGGIYEFDEFYDFCDEHGIAVWQDFMMACAIYPEDGAYCANLRREAEYHVRRLRNHPCLIIWAGDNECDSFRHEWYPESLNPADNKLTRVVIPEVLSRLDANRDYIPSSPYFDDECVKRGSKFTPENHLWNTRDYFASDYYSSSMVHFASEVGFYGSPSADEVRKFISPEQLDDRVGSEWMFHAGDIDEGVNTLAKSISNNVEFIFGEKADSLEDYCFAGRVFQMECYKALIEGFLARKWRRSGIIWWNLLNGWRQFDNSVLDYDFNKKPAYHLIKRLQLPITMLIDESGTLRIINNTENESHVTYRITDVANDTVVLEGAMAVGFNANTPVCEVAPPKEKGDVYLIEWDYRSSGLVGEHHGKNHYIKERPPYDREKYIRLMKKAGLLEE